jgi:hypothetical protein
MGWRADLAMGGSKTEAWGAGGGGAESSEQRDTDRRGPTGAGRRAPPLGSLPPSAFSIISFPTLFLTEEAKRAEREEEDEEFEWEKQRYRKEHEVDRQYKLLERLLDFDPKQGANTTPDSTSLTSKNSTSMRSVRFATPCFSLSLSLLYSDRSVSHLSCLCDTTTTTTKHFIPKQVGVG